MKDEHLEQQTIHLEEFPFPGSEDLATPEEWKDLQSWEAKVNGSTAADRIYAQARAMDTTPRKRVLWTTEQFKQLSKDGAMPTTRKDANK